ncbi:MAG: hypothetical protein KDK91_15135, partial [Gammaproteobacteria bacterium]|nr:hypothetical protein [Gammaproteobacteria bacterium]
AYMVAAKIADNVWEQIIGERLTIANQFARNQAQMRLHRHLTESAFVGQGWSLKSLIVEIVTSRYFNRRPPRDTVLDSAYSVPAVIDPFDVTARPCVDVESDPSPQLDEPIFTTGVGGNDNGLDELAPEAMCGYNGMLHAVHRYAPFTLLSGAASAMDWPRPALMPGGAFPDLDLVTAIGQYVNDWEPGAKDIDFQALLAWDEQFGRCRPPALASDRVDWLNRLVASVDEYNALHAEQPLTLADVVLTLKDWLLQMPVIEGNEPDPGIDSLQILPIPTPEPVPQFDDLAFDIPSEPPSVGEFKAKPVIDASLSEATLLQTLFGLSLDSPVDSAMLAAEPGGEVSRLRLLCGVYLKSPQFMLAGMVDGNDLPEPRLRVCNDGPCSYAQMCEANRSALARIGHPTTCHADHVQKQLSLGGLTNKVVVHSSVDAARQTERGINVMQRSQTMVAPK